MTRPEGGWLGVLVKIGQESKSEEEYAVRLQDALKEFAADHPVRLLLEKYSWDDAGKMARVPPTYRISVERGWMQIR